ncbi:hypothetical protein, conserved [Eimeria tenella]|uniref:SAG family member n=1 Tax=Eimeria tenella TaxID=5802 RepID=U6KV59_EIMTE|nr:hypothetical protein, conserved [Eimeria tenella]CDJ41856.1 hypothetical protein, conserved [Eimeria tenella]|eukprot:XP_013232606.1 hypothetical protein, conserved [Eimeria tenella]
MKSLCTCAAFAAAAAIAHGSFAAAFGQGSRALRNMRSAKAANLTPIEAGGDKYCTKTINTWRKSILSTAEDFKELAEADPTTDITAFLAATECSALQSGRFNHIVGPLVKNTTQ